jgi:hypothetical protein
VPRLADAPDRDEAPRREDVPDRDEVADREEAPRFARRFGGESRVPGELTSAERRPLDSPRAGFPSVWKRSSRS